MQAIRVLFGLLSLSAATRAALLRNPFPAEVSNQEVDHDQVGRPRREVHEFRDGIQATSTLRDEDSSFWSRVLPSDNSYPPPNAATKPESPLAAPARPNTNQQGDLGIRFSKIPFPENTVTPQAISLPFTQDDYPFSNNVALKLQTKSLAHSIITEGDYECQGNDVFEWIELLGGYPSMPSSDSGSEYWVELEDVIRAQELRRENRSATEYMVLPSMWEGYTMDDTAAAVHLPVLGTWHTNLIIDYNKAGLEPDADVLPTRGLRDFIGREVRLVDMLNWAIGAVAPVDFWLKWTVGRPRPEEVAWLISTGQLTEEDGVPEDLVERVAAMNLTSPLEFTVSARACRWAKPVDYPRYYHPSH